jgi:sirohydrochlorin cobaltochelatase
MRKSGWPRVFQVAMAICALTILLTVSVVGSASGGHGEAMKKKTGILLTAFGTSVPKAQKAFDNIDGKVRAAFPGVDVRWAYTSEIIRRKLAKQGKVLLSPVEALAKMREEGFTHVGLQSLHTIPGAEYHDVLRMAHAFKAMPGQMKVLVGNPLLSSHEDMQRTTEAMLAAIPAKRKPGEAVILMGHGTHHPANAYYPALQYYLWKKDPNVFMGTVEGAPSLEDVQAELLARDIKKTWLMPFMSVAGDHAINDMAGDEPDSWKSVLTKAGVKCTPILKGTAEYNEIVAIWVDHLKTVMNHFER